MTRGIRRRCWLSWAVLAFVFPALLSGVSKLIVLGIPAALHGSAAQRFLLSISGGLIGEWLSMIALWLLLMRRNQSFRGLGTWKFGTRMAWALALALAGLSVGSNLRFLPRMHIPIHYAFAPRGVHLVAALALGITAGFCEEVLFRGFLMTEFARAGYGRAAQVILPGIAFGFAHLGYSVHGIMAAIEIMVPTALLGMMWGGGLSARAAGARTLHGCPFFDRPHCRGSSFFFSAAVPASSRLRRGKTVRAIDDPDASGNAGPQLFAARCSLFAPPAWTPKFDLKRLSRPWESESRTACWFGRFRRSILECRSTASPSPTA